MKPKNKYLIPVIALYMNYFVHGIGMIILSQNMQALSRQFQCDPSQIAFIISGFGIGRLAVLYVSGMLSDKYGRKLFVLLGGILYAVFYAGILISANVTMAFVFAICAGIANSFLDAGTMPAIMEMFPAAKGSASVLIKAFLSGGQFVLTAMVSFITARGLYFGYSFLFCLVVLGINFLLIVRSRFPDHKTEDKPASAATGDPITVGNPIFAIEGLAVILIGFTCSTTFTIAMVWLPTFGREVVHMAETAALQLISFYSIGSVAAVLISSVLLNKLVKPVRILFVYPLVSVVALVALLAFPSATMCRIISFAIGFSAAGGILQLTVPVLADFFPKNKGKLTGLIYSASAIAAFVIPAITGVIAKTSTIHIFVFNIAVTGFGVLLGLVVNIRYNMVFQPGRAGAGGIGGRTHSAAPQEVPNNGT